MVEKDFLIYQKNVVKIVGEKNRQRMLGTKLSDETKHRMSESRKGRKLSDKQNKH